MLFSMNDLSCSHVIIQDQRLIYAAFPSLSKNLTPVAKAYGLKSIELPSTLKVLFLSTPDLIESSLSSLISPLDDDPHASLCVSFDAEWNMSRKVGVSVIQLAPHSDPHSIFIIPVRDLSSCYRYAPYLYVTGTSSC